MMKKERLRIMPRNKRDKKKVLVIQSSAPLTIINQAAYGIPTYAPALSLHTVLKGGRAEMMLLVRLPATIMTVQVCGSGIYQEPLTSRSES